MDLTSLSATARKSLILAVFGIITLIIIWIAFNFLMGALRNLRPAEVPIASETFGTLPEINFPSGLPSSGQFTYTLETVDGALPSLEPLLKVYQLKTQPSLFQSLDEGKKTAKTFGFDQEPTALSANLYQWTDPKQVGYTFTLDVVTGSYQLKLNPTARPDLMGGQLRLDKTQALANARQYFKNQRSLTPTFEKSEGEVKFLNISGSRLTEVTSADQANSYRVDLFPNRLEDKYPIFGPDLNSSIVNATFLAPIQGSRETPLEVNYQPFDMDTENTATYYIKSSLVAWEEFQVGKAVVLKGPKEGMISINNIYLGYFIESNSKYLKPVIIFEGSSSVNQTASDFVAVLPAITTENVAE
jgi:hypothetical protein